MEIKFLTSALADLAYWKKSGNKAVMNKISILLNDISEHPYAGIGKPEALKYELQGKWSRRINSEHRVIYSVDEDAAIIYIYSLRFHYSK